MTLTIATAIDVDASVEAAWDVLVDLKAYAKWNPYLVRVQGDAVRGTEIVVHSDNGGESPLVQQVNVTLLDPPVEMRWEGGLPDRNAFRGDHRWVIERRDGNGCRLRHFELFDGTMAADILATHGTRITANFERFNQAFRDRVHALALG